MENKPYEIPELDESEFIEDGDDVITLTNADGEEVDFIEIAGIAYNSEFYAILQPVELLEGMADDEALVFRVSKTETDEDKFEIVLDDEIIDGVFEEYNKLLDEYENEEDDEDEN